MPLSARPRTALLLCTLFTLPACQVAQPVPATPPGGEPARPKAVASAPASGGGTALALSKTQGRPGGVVTIAVKLSSGGAAIAGTQNDIVFDPKQIAVAPTSNGKPDCAVNPQLGKEGTAFSFLPQGCRSVIGDGCTTVRALVLSLSNVAAIANGSVLYTCKVQIAPQANPGPHQLSVTRVGFSNPTGQAIAGGGVDGTITVGQ